MGAWGYGHFEDDAALDFMHDIETAEDPKGVINDALVNAIESEYLESDDGNAAIVAATYIDRQVNETKFSLKGYGDSLDVDTFTDRHPNIDLSGLREIALEAIKKVLSDDSELNELWSEKEADYPEWRQGIKQMLGRLQRK